ncbi:UNVERIFIED_CONTAM: LINE-1 retrotransposable element O protein [Sesamum calycinum]|uniref:LINE-1 retrotransposable element O protein n=1 Tax=Sesamum calycinum TaxID=2727403 RepID=A0AAW2PAU5_9LAMI
MDISFIEGDRFLLKFFHSVDRDRVLASGPWAFEKNLVVLAPVSDIDNPAEVDLAWCDFHVRIHGLPLGKMTPEIASIIGGKIGRLKDFDLSKGPESWGSFMRLRVAINVTKPLTRALKLRTVLGDEHIVTFTYERLPNFCYLCGRIGHISKWCETRFQANFVDPGDNSPFGPWLRAVTRVDLKTRFPQHSQSHSNPQAFRPRFSPRQSGLSSLYTETRRSTAIFGDFPPVTASPGSSVTRPNPAHSPLRLLKLNYLPLSRIGGDFQGFTGSRIHRKEFIFGRSFVSYTFSHLGLGYALGTSTKSLPILRKKEVLRELNGRFVTSVCLLDCDLHDLGFRGPDFTWGNNQLAPHTVRERLDRACSNAAWSQSFPEAYVRHGGSPYSDHSPLIVELRPVVKWTLSGSRRCFRFEAAWLQEPTCEGIISKAWSPPGFSLSEKIASVSAKLSGWGRALGRETRDRIQELERSVLTQKHGVVTADTQSRGLRDKAELTKLILQEEIFWKQRSKDLWKEGDRNTGFFHAKASLRHHTNSIRRLRNTDGSWLESAEEVQRCILEYFQGVFTSSNPLPNDIRSGTEHLPTVVDETMAEDLQRPYTESEVTKALFSMSPLKSPGPDGMPPLFYQKFWHVVKSDVVSSVLAFLNHQRLPIGFNDTHIVLIPKCKQPQALSQYRPISLCNVVYKVASKTIANRLKPWLDRIISPAQSAFVTGRLITDNVLLAFETNHFLNTHSKGSKHFMNLKLDISKAYDRVEWPFLRRVLGKLGFPCVVVDLIMLCVTTVSYSFVLSGHQFGSIIPQRGLRQGDPLSPYLFLLCTESLSALFRMAAERGTIPGVAHVRQVLDQYKLASGQEINLHKSSAAFSRNTPLGTRQHLASILGAGKAVLIQAVVQAIPSYAMSCFRLPKTLLVEFQSLAANFFWHDGDKRRIHWLAWDHMCQNLTSLRHVLGLFGQRWTYSKLGVDGALVPGAVRIWQDPWIPRTPSFRIITPKPSSCPWTYVSDLVLASTREWNEDTISALFWPEDRDYILQIPLSFSNVPDLLIWHYSSNGIFSVRSAYHLALSLGSPANSSTGRWDRRMWQVVWQAHIPNKAKVFMWRAIRNILPTASNLVKRLKSESVGCPLCDFVTETPIHTLLHCSFARQVWALSGFQWSLINSHDQSVEEWFTGLILKLSPSDLHLAVMICWSIWWSRNLKLVNKDFHPPLQVVDFGGTAELAEAFAAREAIRLARRHQWRRVILEGDCSTLLHKLSNALPDFSVASTVIEDVRSVSSLVESLSFSLVLRSANSAADFLAKSALNQVGDSSCFPPGLDALVLGDLAN